MTKQNKQPQITEETIPVERVRALIFGNRWLTIAAVCQGVALVGAIAAAGFFAWKSSQIERAYFATDPTGRVVELMPLDAPIQSTESVAGWTADCVRKTFSYSYVDYREKFSETGAKCYTQTSLEALKQALVDKRIIDLVLSKKLISSIALTGAPVLHEPATLVANKNGQRAVQWRFRMPGVITYQNKDASQSSKHVFDITVQRVSQELRPEGVAITRIQMLKP